jgi:dTDP-4-dehydrorhamnose 3,5-epimerase
MTRHAVKATDEWLLTGAVKDRQSVASDWTPVDRSLIADVSVHEVRTVPKRNGSVTELYRDDWPEAGSNVGQVFMVHLSVRGVSAWHAHEVTTDRLTVIDGAATLALYDARRESPTYGRVNEFHLRDARPMTVVVPPRVWHGIANTGDRGCVIVNMPDRPYRYDDPDHWRVPADSPEIPYRFDANVGGSL